MLGGYCLRYGRPLAAGGIDLPITRRGDQRQDVRQRLGRTRPASPHGTCARPERQRRAKPKRSQRANAPNGRQSPKINAARPMKPRPAVMFSLNEPINLIESTRGRAPGASPRPTTAATRLVHRDPDRVGGPRMTPTSESEDRTCAAQDDVRDDQRQERHPDHQVEMAEHRTEERDVIRAGDVHVRDLRDRARRAVVAVDLDEEVSGHTEGEKVDSRPADDLVRAQLNRDESVNQRGAAAGNDGAERGRAPSCGACPPRTAKNAPVSIIPSRPMFTTPLRSENMPPIAANVSGVAKANIAVKSGVHETT